MWCLGHVLECDEKMFLNGSTFFPYKSILRGGLGGVFVQERVTMVTIKDSSLQLTAYSLQGTCFRNHIWEDTMNHSQRPSLRNTSEGSQKETKFSSRNQFLRRILARSCSEDGSCPQTKRGESRGAQECRSVGGSPRLARSNSHFSPCKVQFTFSCLARLATLVMFTVIKTAAIQEKVKVFWGGTSFTGEECCTKVSMI